MVLEVGGGVGEIQSELLKRGAQRSRRGFQTRAAAATARRRLIESIERGEVKVCREDFPTFWERLAAETATE